MLRRDLSESPNWISVAPMDALHLEYAQGLANDFLVEPRRADPDDSEPTVTATTKLIAIPRNPRIIYLSVLVGSINSNALPHSGFGGRVLGDRVA